MPGATAHETKRSPSRRIFQGHRLWSGVFMLHSPQVATGQGERPR